MKLVTNLIFLLAFLTSSLYVIFGLVAYGHQNLEKEDRSWALSTFWAFFPDAYDDVGRSFCGVGKKLFWVALGLTILWMLMSKI